MNEVGFDSDSPTGCCLLSHSRDDVSKGTWSAKLRVIVGMSRGVQCTVSITVAVSHVQYLLRVMLTVM